MEPTTDDAAAARLAQLDADIAALDATTVRIRAQRGALLLSAIAVRVLRSLPAAESYTIRPRSEGTPGWELDSIIDHDGAAIDIDDLLVTEINEALSEHLSPDNHLVLPPWAQPTGDRGEWRLPVLPDTGDTATATKQVIDLTTLTEDDFTLAYRAAQKQLDLVGIVRTRGDFDAQIRDDNRIRRDLTENQIGIAVEVAIHRYRQVIEETPRIADIEAETFHQVIGEVARFLDLIPDEDPYDGSGHVTPTYRPTDLEPGRGSL